MSERFRSPPSSSKPFGMQGMPLSLPTSFVDEQRLKATAAVGNEERGCQPLGNGGNRRILRRLGGAAENLLQQPSLVTSEDMTPI